MKKIYLIVAPLSLLALGLVLTKTLVGNKIQVDSQPTASEQISVGQTEPETNNISVTNTEPQNDRVFYQDRGVAIEGTDTVAYFTEGKVVKGDRNYSYQWGNTTWWFKNPENRDLFAQNPERYAPQFGGFCAWAVSQNYTAPIDPEAWTIVDNKLYLNYNKSVQKTWSKDIAGNISKGNRNWPNLLAGLRK